MTHRSRSGGPIRQKTNNKRGKGPRKLHHPPSQQPTLQSDSESSQDEDTSQPLPLSAFLDTPSDADILQLIHHALRATLDSSDFPNSVQKVKSSLYDKKWLEVFCDPALLESYAGRWVPSRALCYRELLASLRSVRALFTVTRSGCHEEETERENEDEETEDEDEADEAENEEEDSAAGPSTSSSVSTPPISTSQLVTRVLSLGGGASSELIAIAALAKACLEAEPSATSQLGTNSGDKGKSPVRWEWTGVDIGSWGSVVSKFEDALRTEWDLEEDLLDVKFVQGNLLLTDSTETIDIPALLTPTPNLITILFTLTELMTQSRPATLSLIHTLTKSVGSGTLLLVADSASDISEFEMGASGRKWPIWMILDTILLGPPDDKGRRSAGAWELVRKEDSRWYRLPEGVGAGWPVKLENTRYWMRLYRRL